MVKILIGYGRFSEVVNMKTNEGKTALHYSAWRGHTEATSLLLQNGGSVSIIDDVRIYLNCLSLLVLKSICAPAVFVILNLHFVSFISP